MFRFRANELQEILKLVGFSESKCATQPHINGVLFEQTDSGANLVSTDGHRLTWLKIRGRAAETLLDTKPDVFAATYPTTLLAAVMGPSPSFYQGVTVSAREVAGLYWALKRAKDPETFPPYLQVVPKDLPNKIQFDRKKLVKTINLLRKRAPDTSSLLIEDPSGEVKMIMPADPVAKYESADTALTDCIVGSDTEKICIKLATGYFYEPFSKSKSEIVTMRFGGPLDPVVLETSEEFSLNGSPAVAERVCVVMPRR